ncbi:MAG: prefoldin subunit alpha [Candidatus Micrarchaeia archaeon]
MEINREEIQKIAAEADALQRMQKALKDQIVALNMASLEASVTVSSLQKIHGNENALVSLGSGVFASALLATPTYVIVDIGGGIYGEFTPNMAINILNKRIEDMKKLTVKLEEELKNTQKSMMALEKRARKYVQ